MLASERVHSLNDFPLGKGGSILYWMQRDQRLEDNWAFIHACEWAREENRTLGIVCFLPPPRSGFAEKSYAFMARGLQSLWDEAEKRGVPFRLITADHPHELLAEWQDRGELAGLVCDFNPLRPFRAAREKAAKNLSVPVREVDTHNVVPCRYISLRQEYSAYTLRRKIEKVLPRFLTPFPPLEEVLSGVAFNTVLTGPCTDIGRSDLEGLTRPGDTSLPLGGNEAGMARLARFFEESWEDYPTKRNDPNSGIQSGLSPYLHYGQIAPQTVAYAAAVFAGSAPLKGGFLDELIVRKELSDNFCLYNPHYDSWEGFPSWARKTLEDHRRDERLWIYRRDELEEGSTHDDLWNAAQSQLVHRGKMHGYMRMYWAKKILEWSPDAGTAMENAVYLNDKYSLDGEDPNGYAGCAWAIGGLHDRSWGERGIFGKVRYMNRRGCERKFDVPSYIKENSYHVRED